MWPAATEQQCTPTAHVIKGIRCQPRRVCLATSALRRAKNEVGMDACVQKAARRRTACARTNALLQCAVSTEHRSCCETGQHGGARIESNGRSSALLQPQAAATHRHPQLSSRARPQRAPPCAPAACPSPFSFLASVFLVCFPLCAVAPSSSSPGGVTLDETGQARPGQGTARQTRARRPAAQRHCTQRSPHAERTTPMGHRRSVRRREREGEGGKGDGHSVPVQISSGRA
jgi:hypothetical protein